MMKRKASPDGDAACTAITATVDVSGRDLSSAAHNDDGEEYFLSFFQHQHHCCDDSLNTIASIENLDVSRCRLGPNGITRLLSFLSISPWPPPPLSRLKRICLQRNAIGSVGGRVVGKFLSLDRDVEMIDMSLNDIKAGGGEPMAAKIIANALKSNTTLKVLVMDKCALGPEGAAHLANALVENKSLTTLELAGNMIGPVGATLFFVLCKKTPLWSGWVSR